MKSTVLKKKKKKKSTVLKASLVINNRKNTVALKKKVDLKQIKCCVRGYNIIFTSEIFLSTRLPSTYNSIS